MGEPSLTDPPQLMAPAVVKGSIADVNWAMKPDGKPAPTLAGTSNTGYAAAASAGNGSSTATAATGNETGTTAGNALQMHDLSGGDADVSGSVVNSNNGNADNNQGAPQNAVQPPAGAGSS